MVKAVNPHILNFFNNLTDCMQNLWLRKMWNICWFKFAEFNIFVDAVNITKPLNIFMVVLNYNHWNNYLFHLLQQKARETSYSILTLATPSSHQLLPIHTSYSLFTLATPSSHQLELCSYSRWRHVQFSHLTRIYSPAKNLCTLIGSYLRGEPFKWGQLGPGETT